MCTSPILSVTQPIIVWHLISRLKNVACKQCLRSVNTEPMQTAKFQIGSLLTYCDLANNIDIYLQRKVSFFIQCEQTLRSQVRFKMLFPCSEFSSVRTISQSSTHSRWGSRSLEDKCDADACLHVSAGVPGTPHAASH